MHGGSVEYADRDGGGARFTMRLQFEQRPIDRLGERATIRD